MTNVKECPECGSFNTDRVHVEWYSNAVEEVRICGDCPTQYTVSYANPDVMDVISEEQA